MKQNLTHNSRVEIVCGNWQCSDFSWIVLFNNNRTQVKIREIKWMLNSGIFMIIYRLNRWQQNTKDWKAELLNTLSMVRVVSYIECWIWWKQKMQRHLRSKSEKISDILRSIRNYPGTRITQIVYETCIPHNQLKEYLAIMIQSGLIVYVKEEKTLQLLIMGWTFLKYMVKWINY